MATKKSFTDNNPALAFLNQEPPQKAQKAQKQQAGSTAAGHIEAPPEGYKINPLYIETKSKRVNLLIQPSLYERVKEHSKKTGISANETIIEAVRQYLDRQKG